ncbi:hypothetical protein GGR50DRAFT_692716 [Xylaria sp. CBS 124048]|nr:hypothetical protein GGR50DRAFT_692716 [Xylaria sp. CBS 124048]
MSDFEYEEYREAFDDDRVIGLGSICLTSGRAEVARQVASFSGCRRCVLYWPIVDKPYPGAQHRGWCHALFPDRESAAAAKITLNGVPVGNRTIRTTTCRRPLSRFDLGSPSNSRAASPTRADTARKQPGAELSPVPPSIVSSKGLTYAQIMKSRPVVKPDIVQKAAQAAVKSAVQGAAEGAIQGTVQDAAEGAIQGAVQDAAEGAVQGAVQDAAEGAVQGAVQSTIDIPVQAADDTAVEPAVQNALQGHLGTRILSPKRDSPHDEDTSELWQPVERKKKKLTVKWDDNLTFDNHDFPALQSPSLSSLPVIESKEQSTTPTNTGTANDGIVENQLPAALLPSEAYSNYQRIEEVPEESAESKDDIPQRERAPSPPSPETHVHSINQQINTSPSIPPLSAKEQFAVEASEQAKALLSLITRRDTQAAQDARHTAEMSSPSNCDDCVATNGENELEAPHNNDDSWPAEAWPAENWQKSAPTTLPNANDGVSMQQNGNDSTSVAGHRQHEVVVPPPPSNSDERTTEDRMNPMTATVPILKTKERADESRRHEVKGPLSNKGKGKAPQGQQHTFIRPPSIDESGYDGRSDGGVDTQRNSDSISSASGPQLSSLPGFIYPTVSPARDDGASQQAAPLLNEDIFGNAGGQRHADMAPQPSIRDGSATRSHQNGNVSAAEDQHQVAPQPSIDDDLAARNRQNEYHVAPPPINRNYSTARNHRNGNVSAANDQYPVGPQSNNGNDSMARNHQSGKSWGCNEDNGGNAENRQGVRSAWVHMHKEARGIYREYFVYSIKAPDGTSRSALLVSRSDPEDAMEITIQRPAYMRMVDIQTLFEMLESSGEFDLL